MSANCYNQSLAKDVEVSRSMSVNPQESLHLTCPTHLRYHLTCALRTRSHFCSARPSTRSYCGPRQRRIAARH